jgi:hypothetical protein
MAVILRIAEILSGVAAMLGVAEILSGVAAMLGVGGNTIRSGCNARRC